MSSIVFANGKGGVGKTTLSLGVILALARSGFKVAFTDADRQSTLTSSINFLRNSDPLDGVFPDAARAAVHHTIVDAPPRLDQSERAFHHAMQRAGVVCFPCTPSFPDLWSTVDSIRHLQTLYPDPDYVIALNRVDYRTSLAAQVRLKLDAEGLPVSVLKTEIPALTAFTNLPVFGWPEIQKSSRARTAILDLSLELKAHADALSIANVPS